jgi:hypothetical protein
MEEIHDKINSQVMIKMEAVAATITWNYNLIKMELRERFHPPFCIVATIIRNFIKQKKVDIEETKRGKNTV